MTDTRLLISSNVFCSPQESSGTKLRELSHDRSVQYKNLNNSTYRKKEITTHSSMWRKQKVLQRNVPEDPFKGKEPW